MLIHQISVFLENKAGRLAEVTNVLGNNNIDIKALSIADTTDFGILRLIVNKPDDALKALKDEGFTVSSTEVIAVSVEDKPGGLSRALELLEEAQVGIEYMYAFVGCGIDRALVILRVEQPQKAVEVLKNFDLNIVAAREIYGK